MDDHRRPITGTQRTPFVYDEYINVTIKKAVDQLPPEFRELIRESERFEIGTNEDNMFGFIFYDQNGRAIAASGVEVDNTAELLPVTSSISVVHEGSAPVAGWPDFPRFWRLFSFVLPCSARERYFNYSCEDMVIAYAEATRFARTPGERRWVLFAFAGRTVGLFSASIAAVCRENLIGVLRWVALLTIGRQAAERLIAWVESVVIGS